jgi:transposase InsO family protein
MHGALSKQGIVCSRKRVERLMRENGIRATKKRRFRSTIDSNHSRPVAPNLLKRRFGSRNSRR